MTRLRRYPPAAQPNGAQQIFRPEITPSGTGLPTSAATTAAAVVAANPGAGLTLFQQEQRPPPPPPPPLPPGPHLEHQHQQHLHHHQHNHTHNNHYHQQQLISSPPRASSATHTEDYLMDYDTHTSPDNSATPDSSFDHGGSGVMLGLNVPHEAVTPASGHSCIPTPPVDSPSEGLTYAHGRAWSDPELPFQSFAVSEQWQRDLGLNPADPAARHTQGSSSSHQFWIQSQHQPQESEFTDQMIPRELHHIYDLNAPWSFFEEPPRSPMQELFKGDEGDSKLQNVSNYSQPGWHHLDFNRAGKRNGPLSSETRQNANDVREVGSCLRCSVMRELCDTGYPCRNCSQKEARSWKFGKFCVRPRLAQRSQYLIPAALLNRLQKEYVFHFIAHRGWRRGEAWFALPLEIGLGDRLDLPVREYLPFMTDSQYRPAYLNETTSDGPRAAEVYEYDLPVVIYCYDEKHVARHIRHQLSEWFHQTLTTLNSEQSQWAWNWFDDDLDAFQADIMSLICQYYRADLSSQHLILLRALGLSFFNYVFTHSFTVPEAELPGILKKMSNGPELSTHNLRWVAPSAINKYIKMNLAPAMGDVAERILKGLEKLLLDTQNRTMWRRDIIFAASFIVIAHVGKTQTSLIQLAAQPEPNENSPLPPFSREEAETQAKAMERECVNILILYLKQFMIPSARRKNYSSNPPKKAGAADPSAELAEEHAKNFQLIPKIVQLRQKYAHTKPAELEIHQGDIPTFIARNTHRVCWKFVDAVLSDIA